MQLSAKERVQPKGNWIKSAVNPAHKGALHAALGIPAGQTIPSNRLSAAEQSSNPHLRRMAQLAETFKSFHKGAR